MSAHGGLSLNRSAGPGCQASRALIRADTHLT